MKKNWVFFFGVKLRASYAWGVQENNQQGKLSCNSTARWYFAV